MLEHVYNFYGERWTTEKRATILVTPLTDHGLGLHDECDGLGVGDCLGLRVGDVAPHGRLAGEIVSQEVKTFAQQLAISRAALVTDGTALEKICREVLTNTSEQAFAIIDGVTSPRIPPITFDIIVAQARLRAEKCGTVRKTLQSSGQLPIVAISDDTGNAGGLSSLRIEKGQIGTWRAGDNILGRAWETVRETRGLTLLQSPAYLLAPERIVQIFEKTSCESRTVENLLQVQSFLSQHVFGGGCAAIIVPITTVTSGTLEHLQSIKRILDSSPHVSLYFLPPPPVRNDFYLGVASYLRQNGGPLYEVTADGGSILQIGRYGRSADFRHVKDGNWTRDGWHALRAYAEQVVGLRFLKDRPRENVSMPGLQMRAIRLGDLDNRPGQDHDRRTPIDRRQQPTVRSLHRIRSGRIASNTSTPSTSRAPPLVNVFEGLADLLQRAHQEPRRTGSRFQNKQQPKE